MRSAASRGLDALIGGGQVFDALVEGLSNKQIAIQLDIRPRPVEIFRAMVMHTLQNDSLAGLVRIGILYS